MNSRFKIRDLKFEVQNSRLRCLLLLITIHFSLFTLSGCGYTIQTRSDLPFDSIAIGRIENKSTEPKLQDRFHRILSETMMEHGFVINPSAVHRIEGEVTGFDLKVLSEKSLTVTEYEVIIKGNFRLLNTIKNTTASIEAVSPFVTYFSVTGNLEDIIARKEQATDIAIKNISQEITRWIAYRYEH